MRRLSIPLSLVTLVTTALATLIFSPVQGAKLEIQQEAFTYRMSLIKDISTETFLITTPQIKPSVTTFSPGASQILPAGKSLSIYFDLNSAKPASGAAATIFDTFNKLNIKKTTPLAVTGFTCELGSDEINQRLSRQRAEAVAFLLSDNGYTVRAIKGKGAADPVTTDPEQLYLNRRVELEIIAR